MADFPGLFPGARLIQLLEWGYPIGAPRPRLDPSKAFSVVHLTANIALAANEISWRLNDPAFQNSATFFNDRDGSTMQALADPLHMDPWANGDVQSPDLSNPRIAAMVRDGVNANERTLLAIENVANEIAWGSVPGGYPITPAQEDKCARLIAYYHPRAGVPISRETVIGHFQLNSVSRQNCPSRDRRILDRIVALAQKYAGQSPAPEETNMILLPTEVFPLGASAYFPKASSFSLYRVRADGAVEKKTLTTPADRGTAAGVSCRVSLNGDTTTGLLISSGGLAGWIVSGYGTQPRLTIPSPDTATDAQIAAARAAGRAEGIEAARADLADLK